MALWNEFNIVENGMTDMINRIIMILQSDEILLRLLYYPPESATRPDPLDKSLPNILGMDEAKKWAIIEDRIRNVEKTSDLDTADICRVMVLPERRRGVFGNYLLATQGILISVIAHENFEIDNRVSRISDRINQLLVHEHVGALGKMDYLKGDPRVAPRFFYRYDHVYEYRTTKK